MKDEKPEGKPGSTAGGGRLSVEEVLVLACMEGGTRVADIPYETGMPPDVVREIVERLESRGALAPEADAGALPVLEEAPPAHDAGSDAMLDDAPPDDTAEPPPDGADEPPAEAPTADEAAADASLAQHSATYRQLYETRLAHLTRDERLARVTSAIEPELSAYCFDPEPVVVHRLFENARAGLPHARLVSSHHRTSTGLEIFTRHQSLLQDGQVQRLLLRNTMLPQSLFTRLLQGKRLPDVYRVMLSREIPERTRVWARNLLRQRWPVAQAEERVDLLWKTEGRVLPILVGCNLDAKSTSLLCKRSFVSVLFVRNLATWPATPPPLVAHLLKQPLVKRMPQLRNLLLRHSNVPSEAKRKG